jgi:FixJ family two-component response regulator
MNSGVPKVFIVDDEPTVRRALTRLMRAAGFECAAFGSPQEFLQHFHAGARGCLVLDVAMPGLNGLELQQALARHGATLPIIFLTGQADIPMTVQAMKLGAADFLTKPVNDQDLLAAIRRAFARDQAGWQDRAELTDIRRRLANLTPREQEVLGYVVAGKLNKETAAALGTVEMTIKVHRGRIMAKMGVRSVAELVRLTERIGLRPAGSGPNPPA